MKEPYNLSLEDIRQLTVPMAKNLLSADDDPDKLEATPENMQKILKGGVPPKRKPAARTQAPPPPPPPQPTPPPRHTQPGEKKKKKKTHG